MKMEDKRWPTKLPEPFVHDPTDGDWSINKPDYDLGNYPIHPIIFGDDDESNFSTLFNTYPGPVTTILDQPFYRSRTKALRLPKVIRFLTFMPTDFYTDGLSFYGDDTNFQTVENLKWQTTQAIAGNNKEVVVVINQGVGLNNILPFWAYVPDGQDLVKSREWVGGDVLDIWISNEFDGDSGLISLTDYYRTGPSEWIYVLTSGGGTVPTNWAGRQNFIEDELTANCRNHHLILFVVEQNNAVREAQSPGVGDPAVDAYNESVPSAEKITASGQNNDSENANNLNWVTDLVANSRRGWEMNIGIPDASMIVGAAKDFFGF